jgi:hypothetical protein
MKKISLSPPTPLFSRRARGVRPVTQATKQVGSRCGQQMVAYQSYKHGLWQSARG